MYELRDGSTAYEFATFLHGGIQHTMTQSDEQGTSAGEWFGRINEQLNERDPPHIPEANLPVDLL